MPGLLIGALSFGHLPGVFLPAGPMPSGLPNDEKSKIRQLYAEGKASRADLLAAEAEAYHAPGTCTFYGTANTNQMLMEIMGLHLPGASFVNPNTPLRDALILLERQLRVLPAKTVVVLQNGASRVSYACNPECMPTVQLGDDTKTFNDAGSEITTRNGYATGGAGGAK